MISPLLWQALPFEDETAWLDFLRQHEATHIELARLTKTRIQTLDDLRDDLQPHATMHNVLADLFSLARVTDLVGYDLRDESSFYGFSSVHALDHVRLASAIGLV